MMATAIPVGAVWYGARDGAAVLPRGHVPVRVISGRPSQPAPGSFGWVQAIVALVGAGLSFGAEAVGATKQAKAIKQSTLDGLVSLRNKKQKQLDRTKKGAKRVALQAEIDALSLRIDVMRAELEAAAGPGESAPPGPSTSALLLGGGIAMAVIGGGLLLLSRRRARQAPRKKNPHRRCR